MFLASSFVRPNVHSSLIIFYCTECVSHIKKFWILHRLQQDHIQLTCSLFLKDWPFLSQPYRIFKASAFFVGPLFHSLL